MNRRELLRAVVLLPCGAWMSRFAALAQEHRGQVRITGIKAMMLRGHSNTLIKVETDAGLTGYGEAGTNGVFARARIDLLKPLLVGQDPLAIERLFHRMAVETHPYLANIPTVSGIDIALWDLAGKITGLPVSRLMGGPFRDQIRLYINSAPKDMLDAPACRDWAAEVKSSPHKWTGIKIDIMRAAGRPVAQETPMLTSAELSRVEKGFANARQALGSEIDLMVHCHNEFDLASSIAIARAVESVRPMWLEDPLPVRWSESWLALRRAARVPILTGEKLELAAGFQPFLDNQAVDLIQPDLAFAGGLTGARKIADLAALYRIPIATHNVGSIVLTMASAHFGAAIHDFVISENVIGQGRLVEQMGAAGPPEVTAGFLKIPPLPGLGADPRAEILRANLAEGEPWWGG